MVRLNCKEVVSLQLIFCPDCGVEEYYEADEKFPFPRPLSCLNPACRIPIPPKEHGFYKRNAVGPMGHRRIKIRRFRCRYCGMTFSYLPAFCLPYFQYTLDVILLTLWCHFCESVQFLEWFIKASSLNIQRQQRAYYAHRFSNNFRGILTVLRGMLPQAELPQSEDIEKGAKKVFHIVLSEFQGIQAFSQRFFAQCSHSFMTPRKLS